MAASVPGMISAVLGTAISPTAIGRTAFVAIALVFALLWVIVNGYQYYPLLRHGLYKTAERLGRRAATTPAAPDSDGERPPSIDILLPAYHEADVIEHAIRSLDAVTYPDDRYSVHILTEPGDESTRSRLWGLLERYDFRLHRVPRDYPGQPNKPRALDYGFSLTDAEIVGVIDAEDVVAPELLDEVATVFRQTGADYALGHLDMANEADGWLNLLFRAEYGFWYRLVVPAFAAVGYPIPLGGTTCFFRRPTLEAIAETRVARYGWPWSLSDRLWLRERGLPDTAPWDPHNLTEDFELGLFLWEQDYRFTYLDSITREESPIGLQGWFTQRTRWQTGKLWTLHRYLEAPPQGLRAKVHLYWQSLLPHLGPVNLLGVVILFWLGTIAGLAAGRPVTGLLLLGLGFAGATAGLYVGGYWLASDSPLRTRARRGLIVGLSVPFYWLLQWLADLRAVADLARGRLEWNPSRHLGRHIDTSQIIPPADTGHPRSTVPISSRTAGIALLLIATGGGVLRLFALNRWSLWEDELFTITQRAVAPLGDLLVMPVDPHPPLYFLLARGWMAGFGADPTPMRLLSIGFSLGTIGAVYLLGRTVYDTRTGLLAALLVAVSTVHIHFARAVRMYSLFTLLAVLSWFGYVALRRDGKCFEWLHRPSRSTTILYALATIAMLYTHVFGLFVLASQYLSRYLSSRGRIEIGQWRRVQTAILVAYLPWTMVLVQQLRGILVGNGGAAIGWIPAPTYGMLRDTLLLHAGYPNLYPILSSSPIAWVMVTIVSFVMNVTLVFSVLTYDGDGRASYYFVDGRQAGMLAVFLLTVIVPPYLLAHLVPIYVPRYTLVAGVPLVVLVARGLVNINNRYWRWLLLGIVIVAWLVTTGVYFSSDTQEDWRGVADRLDRGAGNGDLLVVQPTWIEDDLTYYGDALPHARLALPAADRLSRSSLATLRNRATAHHTVWLVTYDRQASASVHTALSRSHERVWSTDTGAITVSRYDRRG